MVHIAIESLQCMCSNVTMQALQCVAKFSVVSGGVVDCDCVIVVVRMASYRSAER